VPPSVLDRINLRRERHDGTFRVHILRAQRSECWHAFVSESLPELGADSCRVTINGPRRFRGASP
jgi:hypothetical protein